MTRADAPSNGFKPTEIGLFPEEWDIHPFTECLARIKEPKRKSIPLSEYKTAGRFPIVDQGAIFIGGYTDDETSVISEHLPIIIFGDHTRIFKYVDFPFALGADGTKMLRANADLADSSYFYFFLKGIQIPSKGYNRHFKYLKEQFIALPKDKAEQRAIAHILSKIQAAAQAQAAIAERARELKRALMAKLFTEGLHGEPLKETEIGPMPESWEAVKLGDACEFLQYGTSERCDSDSSGVPVLRIPNVVGGKIDLGDLKFLKTSSKTIESLRLAIGDILFVRTNGRREYTGRCAVFKGELQKALFASYLIRARLQPETLLPDFLQLYTETEEGRGQLSGRASGAADGKFNINTQTIRAVLAPCPSLDEQREIVHILQTVDTKITAAERKQAGLEELFRAMLGELMTGRVRAKGLMEGLTSVSA